MPKLAAGRQAYPTPLELRLFDGNLSSAGFITHFIEASVRLLADQKPIETRLNITKLHGADMVLGSSWMTRHNVSLNMGKRTIDIDVPATENALHAVSSRRSQAITFPNNIPLPDLAKWPVVNEPAQPQQPSPTLVDLAAGDVLRAVVDGPYDEDPDDLGDYLPTEEQFIEPLNSEEYEQETRDLMEQVPPEYHEFLDLFRKKGGTETLPPPREYDMRIDLLPSAKLAVAPLYQLTEDQRKVLLDTLNREQKAVRIRPSNSA